MITVLNDIILRTKIKKLVGKQEKLLYLSTRIPNATKFFTISQSDGVLMKK